MVVVWVPNITGTLTMSPSWYGISSVENTSSAEDDSLSYRVSPTSSPTAEAMFGLVAASVVTDRSKFFLP
jgi:hypothetical protein